MTIAIFVVSYGLLAIIYTVGVTSDTPRDHKTQRLALLQKLFAKAMKHAQPTFDPHKHPDASQALQDVIKLLADGQDPEFIMPTLLSALEQINIEETPYEKYHEKANAGNTDESDVGAGGPSYFSQFRKSNTPLDAEGSEEYDDDELAIHQFLETLNHFKEGQPDSHGTTDGIEDLIDSFLFNLN